MQALQIAMTVTMATLQLRLIPVRDAICRIIMPRQTLITLLHNSQRTVQAAMMKQPGSRLHSTMTLYISRSIAANMMENGIHALTVTRTSLTILFSVALTVMNTITNRM